MTITKISDTADGVCDADCSLREAVVAANSGDTIVFSPLFNQPQTITLTGGQIFINKSLTIAGPNADLLAVSGNNASRIFNISSGAVVGLSGMRLRNGRATTLNDSFGGAIRLTDSTLTLTNMMLSLNSASFTMSGNPTIEIGFGGAIAGFNSTVSVINSIISDNFSFTGGGIYSVIGIVNISNSTINNNAGGGVLGSGSENNSHILINVINSTFNGNSGAVSGGGGRIFVINSTITNNGNGIANGDSQAILTIDRSIIGNNSGIGVRNQGTATISKTTINNNDNQSVSGEGGGIFNTGTMSVIDSAVTNNSAFRSGGGIFNAVGQLFLTNSTVSGNTAGSGVSNASGGGIYNLSNSANTGGSLILTNSTITNNRATGLGGGLRQDSSGTATFRNTIVAGNLSGGGAADVSGTVVSHGFNLIGNTAGSSGWIAADLLNQNPLLVPLGNNGGLTLTHALMQGSPAINAGSNVLARDPTTNLELIRDQRGYSRISGVGTSNIVDIGAYELRFLSSPVSVNGRVTTLGGRGIYNARVSLTDANGTVIYTQTNPFGYYRFLNLSPEMNYTITVSHKTYRFAPSRMMTVDGDRSDLNFIALQ